MDSKLKDMLIIDPPNELRFCGPFNRPVITVMKITNPTDQLILFKIKTTAPKRYCVRPNFGHINKGESATVEICLQPFVYDPYEKNKHKFMVQSLAIVEDDTEWSEKWKEAKPEQFMDAKLKCVFEMPATSSQVGGSSGSAAVEATKEEKASSEEKISNLAPFEHSDDVLVSENRHLKDENSELRRENLNLKEQVVRLRCSTVKPPMDEPYAPLAEKQIPTFYIAIAILAAFIGLLLGKYLL